MCMRHDGDMRLEKVAAGRSINLALSDRGIAALRHIGIDEYVLAEAVPMYGRMIHSIAGDTKLLPYSGRKGEYINSISRAGLNIALIDEAEKHQGVQFMFNDRCVDFDCSTGEAMFSSGSRVKGDTVIATDGVEVRRYATLWCATCRDSRCRPFGLSTDIKSYTFPWRRTADFA